MLSNNVKVITRNFKSKSKYIVELERGNEYTSLTEVEDVTFHGTEVHLDYKDFMDVFEKKIEKISIFLQNFFLTDGIEFELINKTEKKKISIKNNLHVVSDLDKGVLKIDLGKYLHEIEGYVLIKHKVSFVKTFNDLVFDGELYSYNEENGLAKVENPSNLKIDDYLINNEISYLAIPLVWHNNEDAYLNGLAFTENDVDEVINKMDRQLNWISIIVTKDYIDQLIEEKISEGDSILGSLCFSDLKKLGHSVDCTTKMFIKTIRLFEGRKNQLYLPFDDDDRSLAFWYLFNRDKNKMALYMRSVLIKDFSFDIPVSASVFEIVSVVANINSRKFIPDISRNNLDTKEKDLINYIVGKVVHLEAAEIMTNSEEEKFTLNKFISMYYEKKLDFFKNNL